MSKDSRLDRLIPELSASERAVLCIRATLDDEPEDPQIRWTLPNDQIHQFNQLLGLGNGVLHVLLPHALFLEGQAQALSTRLAWFTSLIGWGCDRWLLSSKLMPLLDTHRKKLPLELRTALDSLHEHLESTFAPSPLAVLPERYADADDSIGHRAERLDGLTRALMDGFKHDIPWLRSRLLTMERVVDEVVEQFGDEAVLPAELRALLGTTRRLLTDVPVAEAYLDELSAGEFDEAYAEQLRTGLEAQQVR